MPLLTRLLIKTSFVYLVLGLILGILLVIQPQVLPSAAGFFPVYFHLLAIGWLSSLIFGIGYWMFPKFSLEKPRGSESLGWAVFILLNAGLVLRAVAEPLASRYPGGLWGWLLLVSAILQWLSGLGFVINSWGRIKER